MLILFDLTFCESFISILYALFSLSLGKNELVDFLLRIVGQFPNCKYFKARIAKLAVFLCSCYFSD